MKRMKSKLSVNAETIRTLNDEQMQHVAGGTTNCIIVVRSAGCPSAVPILCGHGGITGYNTLAC